MARRGWVIGAWLLLLALCGGQIANSRFVADLSSFLPEAPTEQQRLLVDQLRDGAISRVMLVGLRGGDAATRAGVSRTLGAKLRADARFASVANGESGEFGRERNLVLDNRYLLSPNVTPQRFEVAGLRAAIGETIEMLASPAGMALKSLVPRDPTGETLAAAERLKRDESPNMMEGVWATVDGQEAVLVTRTRAAGSDTDAQAQAWKAVESAFAEIGAGKGFSMVVTGPGVFSAKARAMIEHDVERLALVSLAIVVTVLLLVYRSALALGLGLLPVLSGAIVGIAAVSLGFGLVHGITLGFGTTLIGEAVDYSIYLFVQSEHAGDADWVQRFWPTIRLGVLTSIAGFSALVFSGLPGLAQLGVYSITGLAAAAAVTRFVLPLLLPAGFRVRDVSGLGRRLVRIAIFAGRLRWIVLLVAVASITVLVMNRKTLFDPQISTLNPIASEDRLADVRLRASLGASDARHMIAIHGKTAEEALAAAETVGANLDGLVDAGRLAGYESPARYLPSEALQRARRESLPEPVVLRARLKEALVGSPLRAERLEPFITDVAKARAAPLLTRESLAGSAFGQAIEGMLFRDPQGRWTAMIGLRPTAESRIDIAAVAGAIAAARVPSAVLIDLKAEIDNLYSGYFERALGMSAIGLAVIVLLLAIALRSPRRVLRVMAPLVAGVLVVAAFHALSGTRLSLLHLVGLLLVVAIGSNYALFFDRAAALVDNSAPRTLASLALANFTTVASFGALTFSSIPVLHAIGSTVALGAFVTLAFAAMLSGGGIQFPQGRDQHADHIPDGR
ncbi:MAG: MMPL family transporter [Usitatibacter sp.]